MDALRIELYPSHIFEAGFVYVPQRTNNQLDSDSFDNLVYLLRNKIVLNSTEIAMLAVKIMQRNVVGAYVATPVADGLLRGSILMNKYGDSTYYIGGAGYDYSFESVCCILLEYFFNGYCLSKNDTLYHAYYQNLSAGMAKERYQTLAYQFLTYNRHYG